MKPYGIARVYNFEHPDLADLFHFARPGSAGNLRGFSGDFHSFYRSSSAKRRVRRYFKRLARIENDRLCNEEID